VLRTSRRLADGREIDSKATNASAIHGLERGVGRLLVDHGDPARRRPKLLDSAERAGVVRPVDAWLDDDDTGGMERAMQCAHLGD